MSERRTDDAVLIAAVRILSRTYIEQPKEELEWVE